MAESVAAQKAVSPADRRLPRIAALLLGLGAAVLWGASRFTWVTAEVFDDKSGVSVLGIPGGTWSTELSAVALLLAAACVAGFALRRLGRRVVGAVAALAALGASWAPLNLLASAGDPDPARARQLLGSTAGTQQVNAPNTITEWAVVTATTLEATGPVLALLGCALALFGGILLAVRPGPDSPRMNKYERKQGREAKLAEDLRSTPDSGRVMWDALDADIDPTDQEDTGRDRPGRG